MSDWIKDVSEESMRRMLEDSVKQSCDELLWNTKAPAFQLQLPDGKFVLVGTKEDIKKLLEE